MLRLATAGALLLGLGGCALAGAGAGSAIAGYVTAKLTDPKTDIDLANEALKLDAPLKADWCRAHPEKLAADPALAAYCAHVPTDVLGAVVTWGLVIKAWQTEKAE